MNYPSYSRLLEDYQHSVSSIELLIDLKKSGKWGPVFNDDLVSAHETAAVKARLLFAFLELCNDARSSHYRDLAGSHELMAHIFKA